MSSQQIFAYIAVILSIVSTPIVVHRLLALSGRATLLFILPLHLQFIANGLVLAAVATGLNDLTHLLPILMISFLVHTFATRQQYKGGVDKLPKSNGWKPGRLVGTVTMLALLFAIISANDWLVNHLKPVKPFTLLTFKIPDIKKGDREIILDITFRRDRTCPATIHFYIIDDKTGTIETAGIIPAGQTQSTLKEFAAVKIKLPLKKALPIGDYRYRYRRIDHCPEQDYFSDGAIEPKFKVIAEGMNNDG